MPETIEPPRKSFGASLADSIKPFESELAAKLQKAPPDKPATAAPATPPPAPERVVEPAVVAADPDEDIISGRRNPKSEDFKRVKHSAAEAARQRDELKFKAETFEKELGELKKAPKHNAELIKTIEKERDDYKGRYEAVALEWDPDFNASYKERVDHVIENIKKIMPADRADDIAQVLQMPESDRKRKALVELSEDLDQFSVNDISQANRDIRGITGERLSRLAKASEGLTSLAKERQAKAEAYKTQRAKLFEDVLEKARTINPVFQTREGDTKEVKAWNSAVEERSKAARSLFMGEVTEDASRADAALWAAAAPGFLNELKVYQTENTQLKETLAKLQSASPGLQSGAAGGKSTKSPVGSFAQKVGESLRGG
jgi:uncharacterized protein YoxC